MSALWTALHERSHDGLVEDYIKLMDENRKLKEEHVRLVLKLAHYQVKPLVRSEEGGEVGDGSERNFRVDAK